MSIRFDADADYLTRTANLPSATAVTLSGWFQQAVDTNNNSVLISLNQSDDNIDVEFNTDGTSLSIYVIGAGNTNFASSPALGAPFFAALTCSGTSVTGYWRGASANTLVTATATRSALTPTSLSIGQFSPNPAFGFNGRVWGVKVWDRALSAAEILIESYYARAMFPASLNFHWPLKNATDTRDLGGNARPPTVNGTLATEDEWGLFRPRRRIFMAAAVGGGGGFQPAWARNSNTVLM